MTFAVAGDGRMSRRYAVMRGRYGRSGCNRQLGRQKVPARRRRPRRPLVGSVIGKAVKGYYQPCRQDDM